MLDDLRNTASNDSEPETPGAPIKAAPAKARSGMFLGMSAGQRFVIALLLFMMSCVMGAGCLVLSGKVLLPFF